jgi:hypothetical protein
MKCSISPDGNLLIRARSETEAHGQREKRGHGAVSNSYKASLDSQRGNIVAEAAVVSEVNLIADPGVARAREIAAHPGENVGAATSTRRQKATLELGRSVSDAMPAGLRAAI